MMLPWLLLLLALRCMAAAANTAIAVPAAVAAVVAAARIAPHDLVKIPCTTAPAVGHACGAVMKA